ncbi:MAG: hypothetical protein QXF87_09160, partial [Thermofilaceae archaeon]
MRVDSGPWPARPASVSLVRQEVWTIPPEGITFDIPPTPPGLEAYIVLAGIIENDTNLPVIFELLWPDSRGVEAIINRATFSRQPGFGDIIKLGKVPPGARLRVRSGYPEGAEV